jgi:hypothetical protein
LLKREKAITSISKGKRELQPPPFLLFFLEWLERWPHPFCSFFFKGWGRWPHPFLLFFLKGKGGLPAPFFLRRWGDDHHLPSLRKKVI